MTLWLQDVSSSPLMCTKPPVYVNARSSSMLCRFSPWFVCVTLGAPWVLLSAKGQEMPPQLPPHSPKNILTSHHIGVGLQDEVRSEPTFRPIDHLSPSPVPERKIAIVMLAWMLNVCLLSPIGILGRPAARVLIMIRGKYRGVLERVLFVWRHISF